MGAYRIKIGAEGGGRTRTRSYPQRFLRPSHLGYWRPPLSIHDHMFGLIGHGWP